MENRNIKFIKYFLWMFIIPFAAAGVTCAAFCLLNKNYYYLPYSLDVLIQYAYNAVYYILFIGLFITIGILSYAALFCDKKTIVGASIAGFASVAVLPLLMYLIKLIFIGGDMASDTAWDYFYSDLLCTMENGSKYIISVIVVFAIKIFYIVKKRTPELKKNYLLPCGPLTVSLFIIHFSWLVVSVIGYITAENKIISSLIYEIGFAFAGYLIGILPALFFERARKRKLL